VWWGAAPAPRNLVTVGNISRPQRNSLFEYICIRHRSSGNRANPPEIDMRRDRSVSCSSVCTKRFDVHWGCRVLFPLIEMIGRSTRTRESEQKNGLGATAGTKGKWVVMGRRWVGRVGWVVGVGRVGGQFRPKKWPARFCRDLFASRVLLGIHVVLLTACRLGRGVPENTFIQSGREKVFAQNPCPTSYFLFPPTPTPK
jgi:hypothetical protein